MTPFETIVMLLGVFLSLGTFSYAFIGETYWFATSEAIFIGGGIAVGLFAILRSLQGSWVSTGYLMILPVIIGLMAFSRWTKYRWLARYPVAVLSGVGLGVTVGSTIRGQIIAGVQRIITDFVSFTPDPVSAVISLLGCIAVLFYFTYSAKYSDPVHVGTFGFIAKIGRLVLFAGFGYLYASTFVAEGIDALSSTIITIVLRTVRALQGFYG
ncbi:MAG: hypothetical protein JSV27_01665 [Candidatus Bathyarchaeota archaeon]|nr:MAG: hypothetical protein JSV27_01665 [Candidatus Bathyarchaeota archaeon]